jgi:hypothetical protein
LILQLSSLTWTPNNFIFYLSLTSSFTSFPYSTRLQVHPFHFISFPATSLQ